jgi:hypothetical protein
MLLSDVGICHDGIYTTSTQVSDEGQSFRRKGAMCYNRHIIYIYCTSM